MALPQAKQDATEARIAGLSLPEGGWAEPARREALARLRAMGLPNARDEYWKFTRPDTLVSAEAPAARVLETDETPLFDSRDRLKLVFVDGVFSAEESDDPSLEGVTIDRLAEAKDIHWAKDLYGVLEAAGRTRWRVLWPR